MKHLLNYLVLCTLLLMMLAACVPQGGAIPTATPMISAPLDTPTVAPTEAMTGTMEMTSTMPMTGTMPMTSTGAMTDTTVVTK